MKKYFWLAWHFLRYQWREKLLLTLTLSILMGVGSLAAVNFFAASVKSLMDLRTSELLGADWLIESSQPLPMDEWSVMAADLGLETAETIEFLTMTATDNALQLASVKAVDEGYPLRGDLQTQENLSSTAQIAETVPNVGEVWIAPRLLVSMGIQVGDAIEIGSGAFKVTRILTHEPDVGLAFLAMAPRVLMNISDVPATQVLGLGSRVEYRWLVSGERKSVEILASELTPELNEQQKIIDNMTARPEVVQPVDSLFHYLNLVAFIIFILSALGLALATRTYAEKQTDSTAILRCLGATKRDMWVVYLSSLLALTFVMSLVACLLGYGLATLFIKLAAYWWALTLPLPLLGPVLLLSLLSGVLLVLGFAWPWLLNLQNVPPLRVLQRQLKPPAASSYLVYGSMAVAFYALWSIYQTPIFTSWMLFTLFLAMGSFAIFTDLLLKLVAHLGRGLQMPWRLGLMQVTHAKRASLMQIWVFGFVLTLVFLFLLVRQDFLSTWRDKLPDGAPNYFVINLLPEQVGEVGKFFAAQQQTVPVFYPMVRARLTMINDHKVSLDDYPAGEAPNVLRRDLNLSFIEKLDNDTLIKGESWDSTASDRALFSIEEKMAQDLDLTIGDAITFENGGTAFIGKVASIRQVDWYSMQPNFYVIATPDLLVNFPTTYLGSFYLPQSNENMLNLLAAQFPNLTLIDVDDTITSMQQLIAQALVIVEVLFFIVCIAVLLVLLVIQRTQADQRAFSSAVLRTLGAAKGQLMRGWLSEFALIGLLSGILAVVLAQILSAVISSQVFAMTFTFNWVILVLGPLVGLLIYTLLGFFVLRRLMRSVPVLRLAGE